MTADLVLRADHVICDVFVPGTPAPQGSKRALRNQHTGRLAMVESSKRVGPWRADIRDQIIDRYPGPPHAGPVAVELEFWLDRPKGHYGTGRNSGVLRASAPSYPAGKPDVDKLCRAVLDAVGSTGQVWQDDAQVISLVAVKRYASGASRQQFGADGPGVRIIVRRWP